MTGWMVEVIHQSRKIEKSNRFGLCFVIIHCKGPVGHLPGNGYVPGSVGQELRKEVWLGDRFQSYLLRGGSLS